GAPDTPYTYDKNNIQFRGGFAYQVADKTVLRGGYGRYFMNPTDQGQSQGFSIQTPFVASNDGNRTPLYNLTNPDFVIPYVDQFSVGIQREIPWRVVMEVSYAGSRSRNQETQFRGINEP